MTKQTSSSDSIWHYHETTKHTMHRYAAGPEALDWDDQPEAFRWFDGATKTNLPLVANQLESPYIKVYTPQTIPPQPLTLENIAGLFELSLGLSAWKQYGETRWPLRCNPSSGNLHAEEAYAIINDMEQTKAGVYHYLSRDHQLEQRCQFNTPALPEHSFLIGLASIHWREAWKYGERAFRYCQLDIGHAIAAIRYAAAVLGWQVKMIEQVSDPQIATLLGTNRQQDFENSEAEHADVLLHISSQQHEAIDIGAVVGRASHGHWTGQANCLSAKHIYQWPIIDDIAQACEKTSEQNNPEQSQPNTTDFPPPLPSPCKQTASTLIRQRRSAQAFDGQTHISADAFYRMLDMTLPRPTTPPWDCNADNHINLILFVHRIEGIKPGMYALIRNPSMFETFKTTLDREQFQWHPQDDCPPHLPLYNLVNANGQNLAATLSCHQGIAGQSCFSLAMIADCSGIEKENWHYRRLYWEAGMIGQVLYLEAEAAGIRGTGIGCYFDDSVHEVLGIKDKRFQSLYHFTVGGPIVDERIQTIPPYGHLDR